MTVFLFFPSLFSFWCFLVAEVLWQTSRFQSTLKETGWTLGELWGPPARTNRNQTGLCGVHDWSYIETQLNDYSYQLFQSSSGISWLWTICSYSPAVRNWNPSQAPRWGVFSEFLLQLGEDRIGGTAVCQFPCRWEGKYMKIPEIIHHWPVHSTGMWIAA